MPMMTGQGKTQKNSTSFYFDDPIEKIKAFQRSGQEQKQAWWDFCDSQPGKNRDPARYTVDILQGFVQEHSIQSVQGSGKRKSTSSDSVQQELVAQIKVFQRSGEEQKQTWWAFCDSQPGKNRDPARYEVDVLQGFVQEHGMPGLQGNEKERAELVAKIKGFQKSGEEQKQTWWTFCDGQAGKKRDPALYTVDILQTFVLANAL